MFKNCPDSLIHLIFTVKLTKTTQFTQLHAIPVQMIDATFQNSTECSERIPTFKKKKNSRTTQNLTESACSNSATKSAEQHRMSEFDVSSNTVHQSVYTDLNSNQSETKIIIREMKPSHIQRSSVCFDLFSFLFNKTETKTKKIESNRKKKM